MSRKADKLGKSRSFSRANHSVSDRRAAIAQATGTTLDGYGGQPKYPQTLPLKLISENPGNPREELGDLAGLRQSLLEVGLVNAITVVTVEAYLADRPGRAEELRPGTEYVVVDGNRRLAAAREAGLEALKYSLDDAFATSDEQLLEAAYVANVHREDMTELDEATALERLVKFYGSQNKASQRLGISQGFISQRLSLLKLDPALQADLDAGKRKVEHVRGLSKFPPQQQKDEADKRAATAEKKAQQRKRQTPSSVAPTESGVRTAPAGAAEPGPQDPVPAPTASAVATAPVPAPASAPEPKQSETTAASVEGWPFDRPATVLTILRQHMEEPLFEQLLREAAQELQR
ncbi:ParB/RepB/Spo0J family partition protein (plasmid) [Streptomyces sp. NBC_01525]|uniref:ParB/RepB/Spo0J family partition protein n=1 Tax=Streptomyces sp. NBC_01525 TaxID=2903893 RepID=UPI002F90D5E9